MRLGILAAVAVFAVATQVRAEPSSAASTQPQARTGGRVVFVCDRSTESRVSFEREHGAPQTFVSAEELVKAQIAKETWATPRCISAAELQRYETLEQRAQVMRTRAQ